MPSACVALAQALSQFRSLVGGAGAAGGVKHFRPGDGHLPFPLFARHLVRGCAQLLAVLIQEREGKQIGFDEDGFIQMFDADIHLPAAQADRCRVVEKGVDFLRNGNLHGFRRFLASLGAIVRLNAPLNLARTAQVRL